MAGNVNLIDPLDANTEGNENINPIPQYQDMYIVAEMYAVQRGRTVLSTEAATNQTSYYKTGLDKDTTISFLGENQDKDNSAHYANFTTNYYDGATDVDKTYEGFGISSIRVKTTSSYIPQIDVEFIDIRGLAFFNRENSPYRILFDFPPPIFYLTIKGYYGKAIKYQMHLVKYTTEFRAETGNYHINVQFIAVTYAPLTDILFRYVVQAPLMKLDAPSLTSDTTKPPQSTLELLLKLENLYTASADKIKTDSDNLRYESAQKKLSNYGNVSSFLFNFAENRTLNIDVGTPILFTENTSPNSKEIGKVETLGNFTQYNEYIKQFQLRDIPRDVEKRIYIGYEINRSVDGNPVEVTVDKYRTALNKYRTELINKSKAVVTTIGEADVGAPEKVNEYEGASFFNESDAYRYVGIDITDYYIKLYKGKRELEEERSNAMNDLNDKINAMIQENLGMLPTIYNIFKILLDDVDVFFNVLRKYSNDGEIHHNEPTYKNLIINDGTYKDVKKGDDPHIYSFPLIVRREEVCNQVKEVKTSPTDISNRLDRPFPELEMVDRFIETFIEYNRIFQQASLRDERTTEGDFKWIPITPADSKLLSTSLSSPYLGVDPKSGGNYQQPANLVNESKLSQALRIILTRFYGLTQNAFAYTMYDVQDDEPLSGFTGTSYRFLYTDKSKLSEVYIKLYAQAEAINLINSVTNENYAQVLRSFAELNLSAAALSDANNGFYSYAAKFFPDLYGEDGVESYRIAQRSLYRDKQNPEYEGFLFTELNNIVERSGSEATEDDFAVFIDEAKEAYRVSETAEENFKFTDQNLIFRRDRDPEKEQEKPKKYNDNKTKFLANPNFFFRDWNADTVGFINNKGLFLSIYNPFLFNAGNYAESVNYVNFIDQISDVGNRGFLDTVPGDRIVALKESKFPNITEIWTSMLGAFDEFIYEDIINIESPNYNPKLTALLYLSNFGYTLSGFNVFPNYLNKDFFQTPSVIELPEFVKLYMGLLVGIEKGDDFWNEIYDFFVNKSGKVFRSGGVFIFADIYDINTYLSVKDRELLQRKFEIWFNSEYNDLARGVYRMYEDINGPNGLFTVNCDKKLRKWVDKYIDFTQTVDALLIKDEALLEEEEYAQAEAMSNCKRKWYDYLLNKDTDTKIKKADKDNVLVNAGTYENLIDNLIKRVALICFNEITFRFVDTIEPQNYTSLETVNNDPEVVIAKGKMTKKDVNDKYFTILFREIKERIDRRIDDLKKETEEFESSTGDEDIKTQTYYSFKNINDKWLAGFGDKQGYPLKDGANLIDQFAFVDRAMNPIGDTIIDPTPLLDAMNSPDATVFTVISQLLSLNGFEFFPLQNFLTFAENQWEDSFKIDTGGIQAQFPVFVCMYIGGASAYPSGIGLYRPFEDDGITDLENPGVADFLSEGCDVIDTTKDAQMETKETKGSNFYGEVRAFKVRYGEQNQSMFYNFAVDSKEYPETNESIQILSRLAGDNGPQAPVPKGQNLYNLYENRAYSATITGWGNAMIQPTQYFQLENVPLYNGAYVILSVEHNIVPNKMETKFSGTKLLKYPMPRVKNAASIVGFEGGSTSSTNVSAASNDEITAGVSAASNPEAAQFNSMYEYEIRY